MSSNKNKNSPLISSGPSCIAENQTQEKPTKARAPRIKLEPDERAALPSEEPSPNPSVAPESPIADLTTDSEQPSPPRIGLADALREKGLDERKFAEKYAGAVANMGTETAEKKLFVELLKDWGRMLEPARPSERGASDAPLIVQLVHDVPRPVREKPPATQVAQDEKAHSEN